MQLQTFGAPAENTVISRLRQATSSYHDALEARLRLEGAITLDHYIAVLQGFGAFLQAWEPLIAKAAPTRLREWLPQGRGWAQVQQDLQALGADLPAPAVLKMSLPTRASAMGSLYVMEGSAIGAQVIAPRLQEQLGLHAGNGALFFTPGPQAAQRWRDFRFLLEQQAASPASRAQACAGAVATFKSLHTLFDCLVHEPAAA